MDFLPKGVNYSDQVAEHNGGLGGSRNPPNMICILFLRKLEVKYSSNCWSFQRCLTCFRFSLLEKILPSLIDFKVG